MCALLLAACGGPSTTLQQRQDAPRASPYPYEDKEVEVFRRRVQPITAPPGRKVGLILQEVGIDLARLVDCGDQKQFGIWRRTCRLSHSYNVSWPVFFRGYVDPGCIDGRVPPGPVRDCKVVVVQIFKIQELERPAHGPRADGSFFDGPRACKRVRPLRVRLDKAGTLPLYVVLRDLGIAPNWADVRYGGINLGLVTVIKLTPKCDVAFSMSSSFTDERDPVNMEAEVADVALRPTRLAEEHFGTPDPDFYPACCEPE